MTRNCYKTIILLMITSTPLPTYAQWVQWPACQGGNNHWYRATTPGTWQSAENEAVICGGHLVTIDGGTEQQWLSGNFVAPENFWIGLTQNLNDPSCTPSCEPAGGWSWISGTPLGYTNWAPGEPNDNHPDSEGVGIMNAFSAGLWADFPEVASVPIRGIIELETPPVEWIEYSSNGHWYRATTPGTWQSAENEAVACGGHLVTIDDAAEQQWLSGNFVAPENYWIGLTQNLIDPSCAPNCEPAGGWGWISGTPLIYVNWASGEPNNNHPDSEEVGIMNAFSAGLWADFPEVASVPIRGIIEIQLALVSDCNMNGVEDACEPDGDTDGVIDDCDNCPLLFNPDQADCDGDGVGDACDPDIDGDGVPNASDACPQTPNCDVMADGRPRLDLNDDCNVDGLDIQLVVQQMLDGCSTCN